MKAQPKSSPSSAQPQRDEVVTETGPKKTYGKHATMPVLQADCYAEIALPNLPEWDPMCELEGRAEEGSGGIKLDATVQGSRAAKQYSTATAHEHRPRVRGHIPVAGA